MNSFGTVVKKGKRLYQYQKQRCGSKNNTGFSRYGGRGIRVKYSESEFLYWFVIAARNRDLSQISVDRIDSDGHYELGNIQLLTKKENSAKVYSERRFHRKRVEVTWTETNKKEVFESLVDAANATQYDVSGLSKIARGIVGRSTMCRFTARYI